MVHTVCCVVVFIYEFGCRLALNFFCILIVNWCRIYELCRVCIALFLRAVGRSENLGASKVQRANLTCDVIKKLAPFLLSKL